MDPDPNRRYQDALGFAEDLARAAPTAWFAPFPPAAIENSPPRIVSPGRGIRPIWRIMSVFELPTTTIRPAIGLHPQSLVGCGPFSRLRTQMSG